MPPVRLADLSFLFSEGDGDVGICFEYAVHSCIASRNRFIYPIVSEALEKFCDIRGGVESILFGPEKQGFSEVLESAKGLLTDDARVLTGSRGTPLLKKRLESIQSAFRDPDARSSLPSSIAGVWKADLFLGSRQSNRWVAATVKLNPWDVSWHPGLRVAIHPIRNGDELRDDAGLVRIPLPYDFGFMHFFYQAFVIVRSLVRSGDRLPSPTEVIEPPARYIAEMQHRVRQRPIEEVVNHLRVLADEQLLAKPHIIVPKWKLIVNPNILRWRSDWTRPLRERSRRRMVRQSLTEQS